MYQESSAPILISGVGKRLGLGLTRHFLSQGIPVIGTYRTEYPVLKELSSEGVELHHCDFYQQLSVESFIESIKSKHKKLRAIIHKLLTGFPKVLV